MVKGKILCICGGHVQSLECIRMQFVAKIPNDPLVILLRLSRGSSHPKGNEELISSANSCLAIGSLPLKKIDSLTLEEWLKNRGACHYGIINTPIMNPAK